MSEPSFYLTIFEKKKKLQSNLIGNMLLHGGDSYTATQIQKNQDKLQQKS